MIRWHMKGWSFVCLLLLSIMGGPAWAVILDANSFEAVRPLIGPDNGSPLEQTFPEAAGISGAGDVFGIANSVRGHHDPPFEGDRQSSHAEDPVVWRRSDGYVGQAVRGGLPTLIPGTAFHLSSDFADVLDGAEPHPEQKGAFLVPDVVTTEFANNNLPIADNAVLRYVLEEGEEEYSPGGPWGISSPATPAGCRNSGEPCVQQSFGITDLGGKVQELQVIDRSPTSLRGIHVGHNSATGGTRRVVGVSEDGFVGGASHQDNWSSFLYDMNNDMFYNFHGGMGMSANNNGILVSSFADYSESPPAFVAHPDPTVERRDEPRRNVR